MAIPSTSKSRKRAVGARIEMGVKAKGMIHHAMNQGMNRCRCGLCLNEAAQGVLDGLMKHVRAISNARGAQKMLLNNT
jgi:hypothetical protein